MPIGTESPTSVRLYGMANVTAGAIDETNLGWDHPNVKWAILVSLGAGLSTAVGGSLVFFPSLLRSVPQATILAVSLALSAGVMIYVSFIEIFAKSYQEIASHRNMTEGAASAITTICFFGGMLCCVALEFLVHKLLERDGTKHEDICAAHMHVDSHGTTEHDSVSGPGKPSGGCPAGCSVPAGDSIEEPRSPPGGNESGAGAISVEIVDHMGKTQDAKQTSTRASSSTACEVRDLIGDPAEAGPLHRMGLMTAAAIAIHNLPEGLATFLATVEDTSLGASLGLAIAVRCQPRSSLLWVPL